MSAAVPDAPDGLPWHWVKEGVRCACPSPCKAHGGGLLTRWCFEISGGSACGVQQRNLSRRPWMINCPDCWRHPDFKAMDASVRSCPVHGVQTAREHPCSACKEAEDELFPARS